MNEKDVNTSQKTKNNNVAFEHFRNEVDDIKAKISCQQSAFSGQKLEN